VIGEADAGKDVRANGACACGEGAELAGVEEIECLDLPALPDIGLGPDEDGVACGAEEDIGGLGERDAGEAAALDEEGAAIADLARDGVDADGIDGGARMFAPHLRATRPQTAIGG